jgi:hypothetical protein
LLPDNRWTLYFNRRQHVDTRSQPKGASDTLLGLFEEINGQPRYLAADDDSGEDRNASITYKCFAGRKYHVRLRLYYPVKLASLL